MNQSASAARLEELWREILELGHESSLADIDFFSFGGNSLRAATFIERARNELGLEVPVDVMFMAGDFFEVQHHAKAVTADDRGHSA